MAYEIIPYHGEYNRSRRTQDVKYIVVHYTGGTGNAKQNCQYFSGGNRSASAHYFIDDNSIYEYADPSQWYTWHCGDGHGAYGITNANSIGIEVVSDGEDFSQGEIDRLAFLVGKLMADFNVPAERVVRHYDASRKECPAPYIDESKWRKLHDRITKGAANVKNVQMWTSHNGDNQKWKVIWHDQAKGVFSLKNKRTGKYLDVADGKYANGSNVICWDGHGGDNQKFQLVKSKGDFPTYEIAPFKSPSLRFDVEGNKTTDGTNVQLWKANGGDNQKWGIIPDKNGYVTIIGVQSSKALDATV